MVVVLVSGYGGAPILRRKRMNKPNVFIPQMGIWSRAVTCCWFVARHNGNNGQRQSIFYNIFTWHDWKSNVCIYTDKHIQGKWGTHDYYIIFRLLNSILKIFDVYCECC